MSLSHVHMLEICKHLSKLEYYIGSSVVFNIKYNFAVLFQSQLYWLFIYTPEYIFLQTTIVKPSQCRQIC